MKIGLVSCAKTKRQGVFPARELYLSALFQKALRCAEKSCDRVYILSAKHGLLSPDTRIGDYDVTLGRFSRVERVQWNKRVLEQLQDVLAPEDRLYFYCGKDYREQLIAALEAEHSCVVPLRGLSIGEQLRWYNTKAPSV